MKVLKFGGASVKDADAVRNVAKIIGQFDDDLVVVVSAMGKTTNALEKVADAIVKVDHDAARSELQKIWGYHEDIVGSLFEEPSELLVILNNILVEADWILEDPPGKDVDMIYDQIVGLGEMFSTRIIAQYLNSVGLACEWLDARDLIQTNNSYRNASVIWDETAKRTLSKVPLALTRSKRVITQGFIGSTDDLMTTTLGREGSDFTASILAYCLDAESVTIWKDVTGVLNADPKYFPNAVLIPQISYLDAVELAYFGTSIIHPKTIKPLQNKGIPLYVRSFIDPGSKGTIIGNSASEPSIPNFIVKADQVLVSLQPKDFSFMVESHLSEVFQLLNELKIKSNLMQNSALSFSFCMDRNDEKLASLTARLEGQHQIRYNEDCRLLTIRHFTEEVIEELVGGSIVLLDQRTRNTVQLVLKN